MIAPISAKSVRPRAKHFSDQIIKLSCLWVQYFCTLYFGTHKYLLLSKPLLLLYNEIFIIYKFIQQEKNCQVSMYVGIQLPIQPFDKHFEHQSLKFFVCIALVLQVQSAKIIKSFALYYQVLRYMYLCYLICLGQGLGGKKILQNLIPP